MMQRYYRWQCRKEPLLNPSIWEWFLETGSVPSDKRVDQVRFIATHENRFDLLPDNSTPTTKHHIIYKRLHMFAYKLKLAQTLQLNARRSARHSLGICTPHDTHSLLLHPCNLLFSLLFYSLERHRKRK